ncbi:MAG: SAM-dependent methyltransferase [Methanomicrobiaceae archaeon]|nr:SAM-dependent methyltransferase [Methanomicrobiaceae archaeon]
MKARRVPASRLDEIPGEDWVDPERRVYVRDGTAYVPVREGRSFEVEIPERKEYAGRGYQMVGDVALVHGRRPTPAEVEKIVRWARPRGVLHIEGCEGAMRIPKTVLLQGTAGPVLHREGGCTFFLDPGEVMFAMGNREEKARIAGLVREGERVADMFAGIGYFSIPVAKAGGLVHAMELNAIAYGYLLQNCAANRVSGRMIPECGDSRELLRGVYDRILMGHFDAPRMIGDALRHAGPGTVLHVHAVGREDEEGIRGAVEQAGFSASVSYHQVKKYAPGRWHGVWDVVLA